MMLFTRPTATPKTDFLRPLLLLLSLTLLTCCSNVDVRQATLCEDVARILFSDGAVGNFSSVTDRSALHAVITSLTVTKADGAAVSHRIGCGFTSSGPKSADQLALTVVTLDGGTPLDETAMARLHQALDAKGIYWMVSWIPTFGGPHSELAPASPTVSALYFLQLVVNGLTYGSVIALVAMGYSLIFGAVGVINLAFGDIYMIGAFASIGGLLALAAAGLSSFALGIVLVMPLAMAVAAGYSALSDRMVFNPLRHAAPQMPLVASIGLSMVLQGYVFNTGGQHDPWIATKAMHGMVLAAADGFTLTANQPQTALFLGTIVLVAATALLRHRTTFGRMQRACAQDRRMAALLGVDVERIIAGTFGLAGGLAGAGGLIAATYYGGVGVTMGVMMGLKAFTAAIIGGVGNITGAAIGGFVVALVESFAAGYFYGGFKEAATFAVLILLMIFRPNGILGDG